VPDASSFKAEENQGEGRICGLATVLVAAVRGIQGTREQLKPSVKVTWGAKEFRTGIMSYSPGVDIFNPSFDVAFRMPITAEMLKAPANFKLALWNAEAESGSVEVPFAEVLGAEGMLLEKAWDVVSGTTIRASITLRGTQLRA